MVHIFALAVVRRLLHADLGDILPLRGEPHDHGGVYHGVVLSTWTKVHPQFMLLENQSYISSQTV
jgi:hypothetical protein